MLINVDGRDLKEDRMLWGGNPSGVIQLNELKYQWAYQIHKQMLENFWVPEKVNLASDSLEYKNLSHEEQRAYRGIISYLTFLDSIQVQNLGNISEIMTAPEVKLALSTQQFQEGIHSHSYQTLIEAIIPPEDRNLVYDFWRKDPVLKDRCLYIGSLYQKYIDHRLAEDYFVAIVANYLLESLYFYTGFQFFFNLASRGIMQGSASMIKYIKRDELTHIRLFQKIIEEAKSIFPHSLDQIYDLVDQAVVQEILWNNHILGNDILGLSESANQLYIKNLANIRLKAIGLEPLYHQVYDPYKHLEKASDVSSDASVQANFFETTVTSYNLSSALSGWNDF